MWKSLVYGFGGLRDHRGRINFDPRLPEGWPELAFPLRIRGSRLRVRLRPNEMEFTIEEGDAVDLAVRGVRLRVTRDAPVRFSLADMGPILEGAPESDEGALRPDGSTMTMTLPNLEVAGPLPGESED